MTPSRDLYDLIHSLTATEKRYVRRVALLSGRETAWLRLFDAIDRQKSFDERALRSSLADDPMLGNLSVAKKYAYEAVLRAMQSYGVGRDFDSELGDAIEQYKVLVQKGLAEQAARRMREIRKKALEGDAYLRLFWGIIREFNVGAYSSEHAAMDYLEGFLDEQQWVLHRIENYTEVAGIYFRQRILLRHRPNARSVAEQKRLGQIVAPLLDMDDGELLSPTATGFYHLALGDYFEAIGDPERARSHFDRFLDPARLDMPIGATDLLHLAEFTNALLFRLRHRMTEGLEVCIDALRRKVGRLDRGGRAIVLQALFYERWLATSLMLLNITGRIDEAAKLVRRERETTDRLWPVMSKKMRLQIPHSVAAVHLARGRHGAAIETLNTVINDSEASTEEYGTAMLLALVAHVEAGNTEWLDAALRSTTRHLSSRDRYHQTERAMIAGLRRVLKAHDEHGRRAVFRELHERLSELFEDPRERTVSTSIDLLAWTEAHASGRPFAEVIAQRRTSLIDR
jgi:hypothetical protein